MRYVDDNVADLTEAVGSFVKAEEFRDHGGGMGQELPWGNVGR